jgi:hypothetical protein
LLSSDKTTLSVFSGDKSAYPVYMTLGNIPKEVRRKPSLQAQVLIAYLPTTKLDGVEFSQPVLRAARARLYHLAMSLVLAPLKPLSRHGERLTSGDGAVRHCYPIPMVHASDYPEQCLVTCIRYGETCPRDEVRKEEMGDHAHGAPSDHWAPRDQEETLKILQEASGLPAGRRNALLKDHGLNFIPEPFWKGFAHTNMHHAMTSDILHMLFQGLIKYLVLWLTKMIGEAELDARFRRLPPASGLRHFSTGISNLANLSGNEHRAISQQLIACLVGVAPPRAIRAARALVDFLFLAQYRSHTDASLEYLQAALDEFHAHKEVFLTTFNAGGIRKRFTSTPFLLSSDLIALLPGEDFNLPKLHALQHFVDVIRDFGTLDGVNTESQERLHIDLAKDAYAATNRRDHESQMTAWLARKERVAGQFVRIQQRLGEPLLVPRRIKKQLVYKPRAPRPLSRVYISASPSARHVSFQALALDHGAKQFESALKTFVAQYLRGPNHLRYAARRGDERTALSFTSVDVWYLAKFGIPRLHKHDRDHPLDIAYACPRRTTAAGRPSPARFDTVLVKDAEGGEVDGGERIADGEGLEGKQQPRLLDAPPHSRQRCRHTCCPGARPLPDSPTRRLRSFRRAGARPPRLRRVVLVPFRRPQGLALADV